MYIYAYMYTHTYIYINIYIHVHQVEAIDSTFKDIITVATIKEIEGDLVLLSFDGWDESYDFWVGIDDGDFQPPGAFPPPPLPPGLSLTRDLFCLLSLYYSLLSLIV